MRLLSPLIFGFFTLALQVSHTPAANPEDGLFDLEALRVRITPGVAYLDIKHDGKTVRLMRHQDADHTVDAPFDRTSRDCPPFCIQPMGLHPGVETIGELELLEYLKRVNDGDESLLVIDSRTPDLVGRGTIPGSVNIPYTHLDRSLARPEEVAETLQIEFNAGYSDGLWDFSGAKTLVMFCNGPWCGQSPANIQALLKLGYPPGRIKWYRGGMQAWEQFGLTTVRSDTP
jgi:rhodanese-related sulfurtransferase